MKWILSQEEFLEHITQIASRFNYTPQTGERIIVENSITNPIQLTPAS